MPRAVLLGTLLSAWLIAAGAQATSWRPLPGSPYWLPDSLPLPAPEATEDEDYSRVFDLRARFYGSDEGLPLEVLLLGLWLDEADNVLADLQFARDHARALPPGAALMEGIALAMRADYGHDALTRHRQLEAARDLLRTLDPDPSIGLAARVNRSLVELELGQRDLADSLATRASLTADLRARLRRASWEAGLSWARWQSLCDDAIVAGDARTLDTLMRIEPLRAVAFLHAKLDAAAVVSARDSLLAVVDFCMASAPDSIRWRGVEKRAARLRALDAGLVAASSNERRWRFAMQHDLPLSRGLCEAQRADSLAREESYELANAALDRAQEVCDSHYDFYLDYKIQSMRRNVAYNTGDVSTLRVTLDAWERTLERFAAVDPVNDLARGLLETLLGNPSEGERYLTRSYRQSLRRDALLYRTIALENLAFTYAAMGDDDRVARYTDELLEIKRHIDAGELDVSPRDRDEIDDAVILGRTLRAVADLERGLSPRAFDALADESWRLGARRSAVEVHLAAAWVLENEPAESARHAALARDWAVQAGAADLHWKAWALQGRAEHRRGQLDRAAASLDSALTGIDRLRRRAFREDVRARFNIPARFVFDTAIEIALARGDDAFAYRLDEEGRARTLLDRIDPAMANEVARDVDVRATLDSGTLHLQWRVEPDRVRVWALTRDTMRHREILVDEADLASDVTGWVRSLQDGDRDPRETKLYDLLLSPLSAELAAHERLLIVPDGPLRAMPFALLTGPRGPLFQTHVISYEISGSIRCRSASRPPVRLENARPVLIGSGQALVTGHRRFGRLLDAIGECRDVAAALTSPVLLVNEEATVSRLLEASSEASLLHFACHAAFDAGGRAFLQLTPEGDDGRLSSARIQSVDLQHIGMVTLSACETALPQSRGSDWSPGDLAGLSASFFAAGTPGVVATQWEIEDTMARAVMREFYGNLATMEAAYALCDAQRAIAARERSSSGKIRGWGAFCVYGTPRAP